MSTPKADGSLLVRGTCLEVGGLGVLLRGESGAGKSDLALRLIDEGAGLVADDYAALREDEGSLRASAPPAIAGLIEVRGLGLISLPHVAEATLRVVIDLVGPEEVPRLPEPHRLTLLGVALPQFRLCPFESSASAKVRALVRALTEHGFRHDDQV